MTFIIALLALGVLIFVHELGHFLLAKWNGVAVLEFAIGFGKPIYQHRIGETTYSLRLIPLGGFVRMAGDDLRLLEENSDDNEARDAEGMLTGFDEEALSLQIPRDRWFLNKRFWPKAAIVVAGPLFNFLFAIILAFASYLAYGRSEVLDAPVIGNIFHGLPAETAGFQEGDRVLSIDGVPIENWSDLSQAVLNSEGRELTFSIERKAPEGAEAGVTSLQIHVRGTNESEELALLEGGEKPTFKIGVSPSMEVVPCTIAEAAEMSIYHVYAISSLTIRGLVGMAQGLISPKHLGGPILIFKEGAQAAERGVNQLFGFMIFLSVSLGILNLLPIPVLDGGHLLFFILEAIKGSRLSLRTYERANQFGMAVLLLLMMFALSNDLLRLIGVIQ